MFDDYCILFKIYYKMTGFEGILQILTWVSWWREFYKFILVNWSLLSPLPTGPWHWQQKAETLWDGLLNYTRTKFIQNNIVLQKWFDKCRVQFVSMTLSKIAHCPTLSLSTTLEYSSTSSWNVFCKYSILCSLVQLFIVAANSVGFKARDSFSKSRPRFWNKDVHPMILLDQ